MYCIHIPSRNVYLLICSHGTGVDEAEEEGQEGIVTTKERASSPTSAEMDLLVHSHP